VDVLVAFAAALLTFRLAGLLAGKYRSSGRPELLAWAAGLGAYEAQRQAVQDAADSCPTQAITFAG